MRIDYGSGHGDTSPFRRLLRQDVYDALLQEFLAGRFIPGERIRDEEIARRLGVSRTPVREALSRLNAAGLVDTAPNRYTRVSPLVTPETVEAAEVLEALYVLAVPRVLERATDSDILELELLARRIALSGEPDPYGAFEGIRHFCAEMVGPSVLLQAVRGVQPRVLRVLRQRPHVLRDAGGIATMSELIGALRRRDAGAAERTTRTLTRSIRRSIAEMADARVTGSATSSS